MRHYRKYPAKMRAKNRASMVIYAKQRVVNLAAWKARNKSHVRAYGRRRRADPKVYPSILAWNAAYRARKAGSGGQFTADEVFDILHRQKHRCALCLRPIAKAFHVDHREPLARNGSNDPYNLQITHPKCNMRKGAADPYLHAQRAYGRLL
jgi:5-methylcytosine-specific restriction endonuclease McrA